MGLLKPKRHKKGLVRQYTTRQCTVSKQKTGWCRSLCTPIDGNGPCGRAAPHAVQGRTQIAIAKCNERDRKN
jgi:hypothetical protein